MRDIRCEYCMLYKTNKCKNDAELLCKDYILCKGRVIQEYLENPDGHKHMIDGVRINPRCIFCRKLETCLYAITNARNLERAPYTPNCKETIDGLEGRIMVLKRLANDATRENIKLKTKKK